MKSRTKQKPPAKFPMKLKSKPWVVFFSLPMNIKGRAALVSLAVQRVPGKGRAHLKQRKWKWRNPTFCLGPTGLEMRHGGRSATLQFPTASQRFQPLVICKYNFHGGKPDLQNSACVMRGRAGASSLSVPPLVGMAQTWSPNPDAGRLRASEPSSCWLQFH